MGSKHSEEEITSTLRAIFSPSHEPICEDEFTLHTTTEIPMPVPRSTLLAYKLQRFSHDTMHAFHTKMWIMWQSTQNSVNAISNNSTLHRHRWHCVFAGVKEHDVNASNTFTTERLWETNESTSNRELKRNNQVLPDIFAELPISPIAGYELTERGLVDHHSSASNTSEEVSEQGHVLSIYEVAQLIQSTQVIEQNVEEHYQIDAEQGMLGRAQFSARHTWSIFGMVIGSGGLLFYVPKAFKGTTPRNSFLIKPRANTAYSALSRYLIKRYNAKLAKQVISMKSTSSQKFNKKLVALSESEIVESFASRYSLLLRLTNRKLLFPLLALLSLLVFGLSNYSTNPAEEKEEIAQNTQLAHAYKLHTHHVLKWLYFILFHHPVYKDDVEEVKKYVQLSMAIDKMYENSDEQAEMIP